MATAPLSPLPTTRSRKPRSCVALWCVSRRWGRENSDCTICQSLVFTKHEDCIVLAHGWPRTPRAKHGHLGQRITSAVSPLRGNWHLILILDSLLFSPCFQPQSNYEYSQVRGESCSIYITACTGRRPVFTSALLDSHDASHIPPLPQAAGLSSHSRCLLYRAAQSAADGMCSELLPQP